MTDSDIFRTECIRPIQPERPQTEKFHRQAMEFFSDSHLPACLDELVFPTLFGLDSEFRAAILVDDRDTHQVLGREQRTVFKLEPGWIEQEDIDGFHGLVMDVTMRSCQQGVDDIGACDPDFWGVIQCAQADVLGRDIGKQDVACRRDVCLAIMGNDVSAYEVAFVRS